MSNSKSWLLLSLKLFVFVVVAVVICLVIDLRYRATFELKYDWPERLLPNPAREVPYQLVKTGNSHSQDGITFARYKTEKLDLAGVAQRFEMDLALLKQHRNEIAPGALILIPVTPLSFSHTAVNSQKGFQSGYYGKVSPFFIPHLNWGDYLESEIFPFVRSAYNWRKKYASQVQERISAEEKWVEPSPTPVLPIVQLTPGIPAQPLPKQKNEF